MENSIKTKNIKIKAKAKNIEIHQDWFSKIDITELSTSDIVNYCHLSEKEIVEGYGGIYNEGGLN